MVNLGKKLIISHDHTYNNGDPISIAGSISDEANSGPWVDISEGRIGVSLNTIMVMHKNGSVATEYQATDVGFDLAITGASNGDIVLLPNCTLSDDHVIKAGVSVVAFNRENTIFTGEITLGNNSILYNVSVIRSAGTDEVNYCIVGPSTAGSTAKVLNCQITGSVTDNGICYAFHVLPGTVTDQSNIVDCATPVLYSDGVIPGFKPITNSLSAGASWSHVPNESYYGYDNSLGEIEVGVEKLTAGTCFNNFYEVPSFHTDETNLFICYQSLDNFQKIEQWDVASGTLLRTFSAPYAVVTPLQQINMFYVGDGIFYQMYLAHEGTEFYSRLNKIDVTVNEIVHISDTLVVSETEPTFYYVYDDHVVLHQKFGEIRMVHMITIEYTIPDSVYKRCEALSVCFRVETETLTTSSIDVEFVAPPLSPPEFTFLGLSGWSNMSGYENVNYGPSKSTVFMWTEIGYVWTGANPYMKNYMPCIVGYNCDTDTTFVHLLFQEEDRTYRSIEVGSAVEDRLVLLWDNRPVSEPGTSYFNIVKVDLLTGEQTFSVDNYLAYSENYVWVASKATALVGMRTADETVFHVRDEDGNLINTITEYLYSNDQLGPNCDYQSKVVIYNRARNDIKIIDASTNSMTTLSLPGDAPVEWYPIIIRDMIVFLGWESWDVYKPTTRSLIPIPGEAPTIFPHSDLISVGTKYSVPTVDIIPAISAQSAWDVVTYPERHANDIDTVDGIHHTLEFIASSLPPLQSPVTIEGTTGPQLILKYGVDDETTFEHVNDELYITASGGVAILPRLGVGTDYDDNAIINSVGEYDELNNWKIGIYSELDVTANISTNFTASSSENYLTVTVASGETLSNIYGSNAVLGYIVKRGAGAIERINGITGYSDIRDGTVNNMTAIYADEPVVAGGTITNLVGVDVANQAGGTNNYSIRTAKGTALFNKDGDATSDFIIKSDTRDILVVDASADSLSIGDSVFTVNDITFNDNISVIGSQDVVQAIIKANATQTANLQEWQNSAGTVATSVGPTGAVTIKPNTDTTTALAVNDQDGNNVLVVDTVNNRVGVNVTPLAILHGQTTSSSGMLFDCYSSSASVSSVFSFRRAKGTPSAPSAITAAGDRLGFITFLGYEGTTPGFPATGSAAISVYADEAFTSAARGTHIRLETTPIGSTTRSERLRIDASGNIGIGITAPTARLHVVGASDIVQSIVKAYSTQTADLTQWQNSSASVLARVNGAGYLGLNVDPLYRLHVRGNSYFDYTVVATATDYAHRFYANNNGGASAIISLFGRARATSVNGPTAGVYGMWYTASAYNTAADNMLVTAVHGAYINNEHAVVGTGNLQVSTARTITAATPAITKSGAGTLLIVTQIGVDISNQGNAYTTTAIGLRVIGQTGATNNYSIVTNEGSAVFNETGDPATDFRVESDTEPNMILVDANADTDGAVYLGGSTNGVKINKGGEITLVGTATVWEDLNFDPSSSGGPPVTLPDYVDINNVIHREFTSANNQLCGDGEELPHAYKLSSTLYPHVHIFLKGGESVGTTGVTFTLYWELRQSTGTTSGSVVLSATSAQLGTTAGANKLDIYDVTGFAGSAELGGQLTLKLARTAGDAGDIVVLTYGVHYEKDSIGSNETAVK